MKKKRIKKKRMQILILILLIVGILALLNSRRNPDVVYGVSFNPEHAHYLGAEFKDNFKMVLDEWGFRHLRLSAQWNRIEPRRGEYDFSELDWLMDEAAKRDAKVVLAVGQKTPRWPECHLPEWAKQVSYQEYRQPLLDYIKVVINRYKDHPALETWQIENEPFLAFGVCDKMSAVDLTEEVGLARALDSNHKVMVTDSGELSLWRKATNAGDLFGFTLYRVVWNEKIGYFSYDLVPALFYRTKLWLNGKTADDAYAIELQAEPWLPGKTVSEVSIEEQNKSMTLFRLKKNVEYAQRVGVSRAYLWGAEWWYWLHKQGLNGIPNYVKTLKKQ